MSTSSINCFACGAENSQDQTHCVACQQLLLVDGLQTLPSSDPRHLRYRILQQVGTGGFGVVYKALELQGDSRTVALKCIYLQGLSTQQKIDATDTFNREMRLLQPLDHPHLPHMYAYLTDPENWYLALQFIEGTTLDEYLASRPASDHRLPLPEVLDIADQLCSALAYLHSQVPPLIFRDLKPGNIMRTPAGKLYLIDFGIARQYKAGRPHDTIPLGSPGYAAPEQYGKAQTTPQADIYSLGAVLHQLLSGEDPSEQPFQFAPLRLHGGPALDTLEKLIMRMVSTNVTGRPHSIAQIQLELDSIQGMLQRQQKQATATPRATPKPLATPAPTNEPLKEASKQIQQQQQLLKQPKQYRSGQGISRRAFTIGSIGVVGALFTSIVLTQRRGWTPPQELPSRPMPDISIKQTNTYNHDSIITALAWSPDSQWLAIGDQEGKLTSWSLASQQAVHSISAHKKQVRTLDWVDTFQAPVWDSNSFIATGSDDQTFALWIWNDDGFHLRTRQKVAGQVTALSGALNDDAGLITALLAIGLDSGNVEIWDAIGTPGFKRTIVIPGTDHQGAITSLTSSANGLLDYPLRIAFCAEPPPGTTQRHKLNLHLWDVNNIREIPINEYTSQANAVFIPNNSNELIVGDNQGYITFLSTGPQSASPDRKPYNNGRPITALAYTTQADKTISVDTTGNVSIWNSEGVAKKLYFQNNQINSVCWAPDNNHVAIAIGAEVALYQIY